MFLRSSDTDRLFAATHALVQRVGLRWHQARCVATLLCTLYAPAALLAQSPAPGALTLQQAIATAAAHNHDLRLGTLAVQSAEATSLTAAAAPNPTLTLQTFNINPSVGIGAGGLREKTVDSTVRIDQVIERGGKRALRVASAAELESAARQDLRDAARQLRINVTQAYYDLLAAQEKYVITQDTAALFAHSVAAAQKRQRAGDLANADVARLRIDALRAKNDEVQSQADLDKAQLALALLLGDPTRASSLQLTDAWPAPLFDDALPAAALAEARADVRAAQARVRAATAQRKLALAMRTRDVSIGVQAEHFPASATNSQGSGNSYGIAVQIPLFVRYQFDGEIRTAQVALDSAEESLRKVQDQARNDLLGSWQSAHAAALRLQRFDTELIEAAKKSATAAEFAFSHGAIGVMDVLDARRTYRATRLDALAARAEFAKSLAAWQAAVSESQPK